MDLTELHHEIELGVIMGSKCSRATPDQAFEAVGGYVLALDMTARSVQVSCNSGRMYYMYFVNCKVATCYFTCIILRTTFSGKLQTIFSYKNFRYQKELLDVYLANKIKAIYVVVHLSIN